MAKTKAERTEQGESKEVKHRTLDPLIIAKRGVLTAQLKVTKLAKAQGEYDSAVKDLETKRAACFVLLDVEKQV